MARCECDDPSCLTHDGYLCPSRATKVLGHGDALMRLCDRCAAVVVRSEPVRERCEWPQGCSLQ